MTRPPPAPAPSTARQIRHYLRARAWCEWEDFDNWPARVQADLAAPGEALWPPFVLLSMPGIDAATQRLCASRWLQPRLRVLAEARAQEPAVLAAPTDAPTDAPTCAPSDAQPDTQVHLHADADAGASRDRGAPDAPPPRPLRVGYLSADFHAHATAWLMVELLEAHRGGPVQAIGYSHGPDDGSALRQRVQAAFHGFRDIRALDDAQAAEAIRADQIDILVDLKGYTAASRTLLLARRPAPVQVSFLGYPGTLGQGFVDYLISDRFVTPPAAQADYSEALACMPHSYQPHARVPAPAAAEPQAAPASVPAPAGAAAASAAATRHAQGLPETGFVFGCFNQAWKFTPEVFGIWCALLDAVPGSVLWLLDDEQARGNLRREAMARGITPERLVFAPAQAQAEHLARLPCMDLMLDTWPYNAHTTASDALAAGVPLVTCAGSTFASRVAGGLLHATGLPELVTTRAQDYAALALALATQPARLALLRQRLWRLRSGAALFDVPAYAAALEALYARMWQRHRDGLAPVAIDLAPAA